MVGQERRQEVKDVKREDLELLAVASSRRSLFCAEVAELVVRTARRFDDRVLLYPL